MREQTKRIVERIEILGNISDESHCLSRFYGTPAHKKAGEILIQWMENAGAVIAVVLDSESRWWIEDGSAAVENMLIAATALGYGSCWLEGYTLQREFEFKGMLQVPDNRRLLTIIPIGVPTEWPVKEKRSLEEVIHWEVF